MREYILVTEDTDTDYQSWLPFTALTHIDALAHVEAELLEKEHKSVALYEAFKVDFDVPGMFKRIREAKAREDEKRRASREKTDQENRRRQYLVLKQEFEGK
jgi:hypothetical protein